MSRRTHQYIALQAIYFTSCSNDDSLQSITYFDRDTIDWRSLANSWLMTRSSQLERTVLQIGFDKLLEPVITFYANEERRFATLRPLFLCAIMHNMRWLRGATGSSLTLD